MINETKKIDEIDEIDEVDQVDEVEGIQQIIDETGKECPPGDMAP